MANESNLRSGFNSGGNSDVRGQFTITGGGASVPMLITGATNTILELRDQSSGDVLSIFKTDGTELFKVSTTGITVGGDYTLPLTDGTSDQILQTNGAGTISFVDFGVAELSNVDGSMHAGTNPMPSNVLRWDYTNSKWRYGSSNQSQTAYNPGPSTIAMGAVVKYAGVNSGTYEPYISVQTASANTDTIMGLAIREMNTTTTAVGAIMSQGIFGPIDTTAFSVNDKLYVSTSGTLTATPPTTGPIIYVGRVISSSVNGYYDLKLENNFAGGIVTNSTFEAGEVVTWDGDTFVNGNPRVLTSVHNNSGGTLTKGTPVYVSGTHASGLPTIAGADSNGASTYPALGLVLNDITDGNDGKVVVSGILDTINTSSYSAGDALYISSTAGVLTTTRPTASSEQVQKVGLVTRVHATSGTIEVMGAGRTNDVPNELTSLTGVALDATDLGTFTGTTIPDSRDIKTALQDLETAVEAGVSDTGDLGDVTLAGLSQGDILLYDGVSTWQNAGMGVMSNTYTTLANHSNVLLSSEANGNSLIYNGTNWVNQTLDLDDVVQAGALTTAGIFVDYITTTGTGNNTFSGAVNMNKGALLADTDLSDSFELRSTDATATNWDAININRLSNSAADNDIIGTLRFSGKDDANSQIPWAGIKAEIDDATAVSSAGRLTLQYASTGTQVDAVDIDQSGVTLQNYTLPYGAGTSGQVLKYPSSGSTLEWGDAGGGSTPVAYLNKSYRTFASTTEDLYYWFPGDDDYGVDDFIAENLSALPTVILGKINYGHVVPSGTRDLDITFVMSITDGSGSNVSVYNSQSPDIYFYKVDQTNGWQQIGTTQTLTMDATNTAIPKELSYTISSQSFSVGEKLAVVLKGTQNVTSNTFIMWGYNIVVT